jgi:hypothetical protein
MYALTCVFAPLAHRGRQRGGVRFHLSCHAVNRYVDVHVVASGRDYRKALSQ